MKNKTVPKTPLETDISALSHLLKSISDTHQIKLDQLFDLIQEQQDQQGPTVFPLCIIKEKKLGIMESVVKFLREQRQLKFSDIAKTLNRNERVVWVTYTNAKRKHPRPLDSSGETRWLPLSLFATSTFGPLKALVTYLRDEQKLSFKEIGTVLGRDNRVVWAVYHRKSTKKQHGT